MSFTGSYVCGYYSGSELGNELETLEMLFASTLHEPPEH
jgi:hypothetical protein